MTLNPYVENAAQVVLKDVNGNELLHSIPLVERNHDGFREDANTIGEDYGRQADTVLETHRKEVERFVFAAETDAEAAAKRAAGATPFAGRIDPYKVIEQAPQRTFLPKRGADMVSTTTTRATVQPVRLLNAFEVAAWLAQAGVAMDRDKSAHVRSLYPDGVPESELQDLQARLTVRAGLRVVAGGGA